MKYLLKSVFVVCFIFGCARAPIKDRSEAMRKASAPTSIFDDADFENLVNGIKANADYIKNSSRAPNQMVFGKTVIEKSKYVSALKKLIENSDNFENYKKYVLKNFDFYEVYGNEKWGEIKATSYYTPLLKGSPKKTAELSQALYSSPDDMVYIDIDAFVEAFPNWKIVKEDVLGHKQSRSLVKARVLSSKDGNTRILPYFNRLEIDEKAAIKNKDLVIAYVDPVEAFFLQIQGSGVIELKDGTRFNVGYANQNGHPYVGIGSKLLDKIPKEKISMQTIKEYLRSLPKNEMQKILNQNPSYVFFQKIETKPAAFLGTEVVDGRTVATDNNLFPKGALAYLEYERPVFEKSEDIEPKEWIKSSRFVLDQDRGGDIRGPGRLDLYAGTGEQAAQFAGVMKNPGRLYYLVPKENFLKTLD